MLEKRSYFLLTHSDIRDIIHSIYRIFSREHEQSYGKRTVEEGMDRIESKQELLYQKNGKAPRRTGRLPEFPLLSDLHPGCRRASAASGGTAEEAHPLSHADARCGGSRADASFAGRTGCNRGTVYPPDTGSTGGSLRSVRAGEKQRVPAPCACAEEDGGGVVRGGGGGMM